MEKDNVDLTEAKNMKYVRKSVEELVPGDIILHSIYRLDGLILIKKYKVMTDILIRIIKKQLDMKNIPVIVAPNKEVLDHFIRNKTYHNESFLNELRDMVKEYNNLTPFQITYDSFVQNYLLDDVSKEEHINSTNRTEENKKKDHYFSDLLSISPLWNGIGSKLESDRMQLRAERIKAQITDMLKHDLTFYKLLNLIKNYSSVLLIHSINTTCIALMIGLTLELQDEDLIDLAIAALFSNIGYVKIPKNNFREFLRDNEKHKHLLAKHIELFTEMTDASPSLRKKTIIYGILDHHEFYNGKGYPKRKSGKQINLFGRILLLAQEYDEMVGGYFYTQGLLPREAIKIIIENREMKYDSDIVKIFINRTNYFKIGEPIFLSSTLKGMIIGFTDYIGSPHLPIVQLDNGKVIDLTRNSVLNQW